MQICLWECYCVQFVSISFDTGYERLTCRYQGDTIGIPDKSFTSHFRKTTPAPTAEKSAESNGTTQLATRIVPRTHMLLWEFEDTNATNASFVFL